MAGCSLPASWQASILFVNSRAKFHFNHHMLLPTVFLAPGPGFWSGVVQHLLATHGRELSGLRLVVPAYSHAMYVKQELARQSGGSLIAPRINTLDGWLNMQAPQATASTPSQRLTTLYDQLRQQEWLKKLFGARSNTDLLPLAQLLLTMADELTEAHLPTIVQQPELAEQYWQQGLAQLPDISQQLLSDEANLVWTLWQTQLDQQDGLVLQFARMLQLAQQSQDGLVWISPDLPSPTEMAFLQAYGKRQKVWRFHLDWHASCLPRQLQMAWPEIIEAETTPDLFAQARGLDMQALAHLKLAGAASLEEQAVQSAQIVLDWLRQGYAQVAIIAQDRVAARRIAALLARAEVVVADETGWKLSTTRAAAALAAWFEVVASQAETVSLFDLLKSPFLQLRADGVRDLGEMVMQIELALRRANVLGGWEQILHAVQQTALPQAAQDAPMLLRLLRKHAANHVGRQSISQWCKVLGLAMQAMGMRHALARDEAGRQILRMLDQIALDQDPATLSFAEWRAMLCMQMENLPFLPVQHDKRVIMLPLNGARLRHFDALLLVGCDADNLPSHAPETLFFANAVRRELGLATRESRQKQQMRDFAEMLLANREVVLSWQTFKNHEPNPLSPWLQRLELYLQQQAWPALSRLETVLPAQTLHAQAHRQPSPAAAQLLPAKLSASAYKRFFDCPYQFYARQMLQLNGLDELSDLPEKRDYGDWLHEILQKFHDALLQQPDAEKPALLTQISDEKFALELEKNAAALGYQARWQQSMPAYLAWLSQHESQGWRYMQGEQGFERSLAWGGGQILLKGRLDRIDQHQDGRIAVLDYKTSNASSLRTKLKGGEDVQLAFYGLLTENPEQTVASAAYVTVDAARGKVEKVEVGAEDYAQRKLSLEAHICASMQALQDGAGLPANGVDEVCQYCEVRGLCRKGAWQ